MICNQAVNQDGSNFVRFIMMNKSPMFLLVLLSITSYVSAQQYTLSNQSEIKFVTKHLGVFNVDGEFSEYSGKLYRKGDTLSGKGSIVVNSIYTGNKARDKDLRSEKFLDVDSFPNIEFLVLTTAIKGKISTMTGKLTIKDKSLDITFPFEIMQTGRGLLIEFETVIDRTDFELYFDSLDGLVGNEVKLYSYLLFEPE